MPVKPPRINNTVKFGNGDLEALFANSKCASQILNADGNYFSDAVGQYNHSNRYLLSVNTIVKQFGLWVVVGRIWFAPLGFKRLEKALSYYFINVQ